MIFQQTLSRTQLSIHAANYRLRNCNEMFIQNISVNLKSGHKKCQYANNSCFDCFVTSVDINIGLHNEKEEKKLRNDGIIFCEWLVVCIALTTQR